MGAKSYDSRWVGRMPLAFRMLRFVANRPMLVFAVYFVLVAILAFAPASGGIRAFYLVVAPWLLMLMLVLHVPLLGAAGRTFRLPNDVRVNHALEHGTIFLLRRRYGRKFKIGGRAEADGFRLNGLPAPDLISPAFQELREHLATGNRHLVVSRYCGSMLVAAQALSAISLTVVAVLFLLLQLEPRTKLGLLAAVLGMYLLFRHQLGYVLQRRLFLSLDFDDAEIRSIKRVK